MKRPLMWLLGFWLINATVAATECRAGSPFRSLLPFKKIEADANKAYVLKDEHGPWLILAATFYGEHGEQQAKRLVLELRRDHQLPAYTYRKTFDYGDTVTGRGFDKYGRPKQMRHVHASRFQETAVLVGDFETPADANAKKVLQKIKYMRPETLSATKENPTAQRFVVWRAIQKAISPDEQKKSRGPMGSAFVTRNPILPVEFFVNQGPDKFVVKLNKGVKHSLLGCRGNYTVKVATFRGESTWDVHKMEEIEAKKESRLAQAADKAHRLVTALRKHGIEAYEFHDRHESIVTVGSFVTHGQKRPDGKIEINPGIHQIMKSYGAQPLSTSSQGTAMAPRVLEGIPFDAQPIPVRVPKLRQ